MTCWCGLYSCFASDSLSAVLGCSHPVYAMSEFHPSTNPSALEAYPALILPQEHYDLTHGREPIAAGSLIDSLATQNYMTYSFSIPKSHPTDFTISELYYCPEPTYIEGIHGHPPPHLQPPQFQSLHTQPAPYTAQDLTYTIDDINSPLAPLSVLTSDLAAQHGDVYQPPIDSSELCGCCSCYCSTDTYGQNEYYLANPCHSHSHSHSHNHSHVAPIHHDASIMGPVLCEHLSTDSTQLQDGYLSASIHSASVNAPLYFTPPPSVISSPLNSSHMQPAYELAVVKPSSVAAGSAAFSASYDAALPSTSFSTTQAHSIKSFQAFAPSYEPTIDELQRLGTMSDPLSKRRLRSGARKLSMDNHFQNSPQIANKRSSSFDGSHSDHDSALGHAESPADDTWRCHFKGCDKSYSTSAGLRYHLKATHSAITDRAQKLKNREMKFCCRVCDKWFGTAAGLRYHNKTVRHGSSPHRSSESVSPRA
ncbi:uncharacterized protein BJ171DRAFT_581271 [Polychytrium aggregatum]|uniref:uncharacterized protein n=1 Tax=Polychytrium aggregatum TaxID=110093 RepID=UPI0022FE0134|nr:uncharacterized protein BJ171DRAFT_581271 [Polychytrium aggregatum]KAI9205064.1 hypothetical protein BJ171DRAFT_581271 [Polychytrium aggregatum]